ncbi:leucine-rich repeat-containing G-protein coupled receptor 5-like [Limulus polyphemus]|uniref:Leucine-rich repeat-containing G-protein coupled receptor 5-like n=1 Tax=Limulus polyphemus TaxID=6850 RepID=A0ABM1SLI5_LIMPO|nr:leucine-rich repeat-containing G-protein coupled receptor 5-like [Limulus polyphemus]
MLYKLEQLILYYNAIRIIPDHAFGLHTKLKEINLSFNMIHYVGSFAFENLLALRVLNLRYNKLFVLNNYAFAVEQVNPNLLLDLSNNYIIFVSEETFRNQVPKLLNISNNHLQSLSKSNFENMLKTMTTESYGMIVTKGNRFLCTCENSAWWVILPYVSKQYIKGFVCSDLNINLMNVTFKDIRCKEN